MSALGQKQTFHAALRESALPPKADIGAAVQNVRLVPIADIGIRPMDAGQGCHRALRQCPQRAPIAGSAAHRSMAVRRCDSVRRP